MGVQVQNNLKTSTPSVWRFMAGLFAGIIIFAISTFFIGPNIVIPIIGILLAAEIAHLESPRGNAVMGALIGAVFGLFYSYTQLALEEFTLAEKFLMGLLVALGIGIFYGIIGFVVGKLMRKYRESKGFFF